MIERKDSETKIRGRENETRRIDRDASTLPCESEVRIRESKEEVEFGGIKGGGLIRSFSEDETKSYIFPGSMAPEEAVKEVLGYEGMLSAVARSGYYVDAKIVFAGELGEKPEESGNYREVDLDFGPYQFCMEGDIISVSKPLGAAGSYAGTLGEMVKTGFKGNNLTPAERQKLDIMVRINNVYKGNVLEGVNRVAQSGIIRNNKKLDEESADLFNLAEDTGIHRSLEAVKMEERKRRLREITKIFPFNNSFPKKN